jgi:hypothetical protein
MMGVKSLKFERVLTVGDVLSAVGDFLTILSIFVAAGALYYSWDKDRAQKAQDQAQRLRHSASLTLSKLEEWEGISGSLYLEVRIPCVDAASYFTQHRNPNSADNKLYKGITEAHNKTLSKIADSQIELAYADLYEYDPKIRTVFERVITSLRAKDRELAQKFYYDTNRVRATALRYPKDKAKNDTNNNLRVLALQYEAKLEDEMDLIIGPCVMPSQGSLAWRMMTFLSPGRRPPGMKFSPKCPLSPRMPNYPSLTWCPAIETNTRGDPFQLDVIRPPKLFSEHRRRRLLPPAIRSQSLHHPLELRLELRMAPLPSSEIRR